jgi:hypothetical protein
LLDNLKTWMEAQRRRASSKTELGKALLYALGRWEALTRYVDDGRLAIDKNWRTDHCVASPSPARTFSFLGPTRLATARP